MVVSGGVMSEAREMSSNPMTEMSSGTFKPSCQMAVSVPMAISSVAANTAVISG